MILFVLCSSIIPSCLLLGQLSSFGLLLATMTGWETWNPYDLMHVHSAAHCVDLTISFLHFFCYRSMSLASSRGSCCDAIGLPRTGRCSWRGCMVLVLRAGNELFLPLNVDSFYGVLSVVQSGLLLL